MGQDRLLELEAEQAISIHPPARGGTEDQLASVQASIISIHPPARGGTNGLRRKTNGRVFQSTHPQGVGRFFSFQFLGKLAHFNPPTRKGWDAVCVIGGIFAPAFQSTHPQGVGPMPCSIQQRDSKKFQSTHPQGVGRGYRHHQHQQGAISIHPPARGGTEAVGDRVSPIIDFNPPTRKGWDWFRKPPLFRMPLFQSTHPQGVGRGWICLTCRW